MTDQDFPVEWPAPGDELVRWNRCGSGWDRPGSTQVRPLLADLAALEQDAFARRNAGYGGPCGHERFAQFHGYLYVHSEGPDREALKRWSQDPPPPLRAMSENPLTTWQRVLLPPVRHAVERIEAAELATLAWRDLQGLLEDALMADERVEQTIGALEHVGDLPGRFLERDRALFGEDHQTVAIDLFRGLDCLLLHMVQDVVRLQSLARELPEVGRALRAAPPEALNLLDQTTTGRVFKEALLAFLDRHGRRFEWRHLWEPSWREDPSPVLTLLRGDLPRRGWDPLAAATDQTRARDAAEAAVRARLESCAPQDRAEYWELLRVAREERIVNEDYDVWMQQRCRVALRHVLLAFARRLSATGRLDHAEDVWWLRLEELLGASYSVTAWRRLVASRKAEWARWSTVTPPRQLGAVEASGAGTQPRPAPQGVSGATQPRQISGLPVSSGTAQGPARIIDAWDDVANVAAGDILVPTWMCASRTLLLTRAAGVVVGWGSPLERTALVARHLGIPAVVGCRQVERIVREGQPLALDGDAGTVRLGGDGRPAPLEDWFHNAGTSDDAAPWTADMDGYGWSLSAQALEAAGIRPGAVVTVDGMAFAWPKTGPGQPDNVVAAGQVLELPARPGATRLGILGLSSQGSCTGLAEIGYSDGGRAAFPLALPDWVAEAHEDPPPGVQVAVRLPRWNDKKGGATDVTTVIFAALLPVRSDRTAVSLTLPRRGANRGEQHIFAVSLAGDHPESGAI